MWYDEYYKIWHIFNINYNWYVILLSITNNIMKFASIVKKFTTDFSFRKRSIITAVIIIIALCGITVIPINWSSLLDNVMIMTRPAVNISILGKCSDSDGGINYYVQWTTAGLSITTNQFVTKDDVCVGNTITEYFCNNKKVDTATYTCANGCSNGACLTSVNCNTPEITLACSLWLSSCPPACTWQTVNCSDPNTAYACANCNAPENQLACQLGLNNCPSACQWPVTTTWSTCPSQCISTNGYGYGYGWWGQGTGYGYGYGYKKINTTTQQPYLYLINVFAKYSKTVYDAVISKLGFKVVKFYNTKEFIPAKTITPIKTR